MPQDTCVSLSSRQQKTMLAGTRCQQKMKLELCPAPAGLISTVSTLNSCITTRFIKKCDTFQQVTLSSKTSYLLHLQHSGIRTSPHPWRNLHAWAAATPLWLVRGWTSSQLSLHRRPAPSCSPVPLPRPCWRVRSCELCGNTPAWWPSEASQKDVWPLVVNTVED